MSEQYTPTPWEVCTTDDGTYIRAVELYKTTEKNYVHGGTYETENTISIASTHAATTKKYYPQRPEAEANARRIVACVNACAGIPTDELERVKDLERERDALRAECMRLKSVIGKWERAEPNELQDAEAELIAAMNFVWKAPDAFAAKHRQTSTGGAHSCTQRIQ